MGVAGQVGAEVAGAQVEVEGVDRLPQLARDELADAAGVLPRHGDAGDDGDRGRLLQHEELGDAAVVEGSAARREGVGDLQDLEEVPPRARRLRRGRLEHAVVGDVEEQRDVLRPLDVATGPEQVLRQPCEHQRASSSPASTQVSFDPPPWEELTISEPFGGGRPG
jgi:hypothetical protein